jgi:hypothetical protein
MGRLYKQFYLAVIASLALVVLAAGALWSFAPRPGPEHPAFEMAGELAAALLPPADAGIAAQKEAIDRLHKRLKIDLALFDSGLKPIAAAGHPVPAPRREVGGWLYGRGGPSWAIRLPDERWIVARAPGRHRP